MKTKKEVAFRYSPDLTYSGAVNRLRRYINGDRDLLKALQDAGYKPENRGFTERQVKILDEFLE